MRKNLDKPRSRVTILAVLAVVVVLGLASRSLADRIPVFIANHAGDALWTVAAYLTLALAFPRWSPLRLGLIAFCASVVVELSQLVDADWLNSIRQTVPGRLLFGAGFLWVDLLRYLGGALLATLGDWLLVRCVHRRLPGGTDRSTVRESDPDEAQPE